MQDNKFLSREKTQALIDGLGIKQSEGKAFLDGLAAKGYTIQGFNDQPKVEEKSFLDKIGSETKRLSSEYQRNVGESEARQARGEQTGLETAAQTFGEAARGGVGTLLSPLTVGVGEILKATGVTQSAEERAKATQAYIAEQKAINPNYNPETDPKLNPFTAGALQSAQNSPFQERPLTEREKANFGIISNVGGAALDVAGALEGVGALKTAAGTTARTVASGAKQTASTIANAPIVSGTGEVLKSAGRTLKSVPENISTNVGEMKAAEQAIKSIPSMTGQNAVRKGVDLADATILQKAIQTPEAKNLIQTIKNYAAGDKSISPFEVVGKPVVARLKSLDMQVKKYATQLDTVAQNLKGQTVNDLSKIQSSVLDGLDKMQINISKGGLDFVGSSLEGIGSSGKIVDNVYKRIEKANDAFDLHNLKKYIDANVSYGKRVEGLDAGAERLLKTWRKAIDDTLDTQFTAYNKVNTELAKRISPLEDLKSILKNTDGLDTDLLNQKAGIIARRITSAAASNPEIKQVLRNLDQFTSTSGKTLGKIENLQDLYNVLNKYYDIAPKTGFQNLVKEGVTSAGGFTDQIVDTVKGFAGSTNAVRTKALENYLDELLNPAKAKTATKARNSKTVQTKNIIMSDTIPQTTKGASGKKMSGFAQISKDIPKELQPLANPELNWDTIPEEGVKAIIPLDKIKVSSKALEKATNNVKKGEGSRTSGPIEIALLKDGTFAIEEGHHRAVQKILQGDKNIEATVYSTKHSASPDSKYANLDTTFIKSNPLAEEARKYKSAEEFMQKVKGGGTQYGDYTPGMRANIPAGYKNITEMGIDPEEMVTVYRGIDDLAGKIKKKKINDGDFVTTDFDSALSYTGDPKNVVEMQVPAKTLYNSEPRDFLDEPFYTGAEYIYTAKNAKPLPTDKELIDLWNKANNKQGGFANLGVLPKLGIGTAVATGGLKAGVEYKKSKNK